MKQRLGFVSNSSSSSYVVAFACAGYRNPFTTEQLMEILSEQDPDSVKYLDIREKDEIRRKFAAVNGMDFQFDLYQDDYFIGKIITVDDESEGYVKDLPNILNPLKDFEEKMKAWGVDEPPSLFIESSTFSNNW